MCQTTIWHHNIIRLIWGLKSDQIMSLRCKGFARNVRTLSSKTNHFRPNSESLKMLSRMKWRYIHIDHLESLQDIKILQLKLNVFRVMEWYKLTKQIMMSFLSSKGSSNNKWSSFLQKTMVVSDQGKAKTFKAFTTVP